MGPMYGQEFRLVPEWEQLPAGVKHLDGSDVAVDSEDRVYVLGRAIAAVFVYDSSGTALKMWGEDTLSDEPHGLTIGPDGLVYCVDKGKNAVFIFTPDGALVRTLAPGDKSTISSDPGEGGRPFNLPTKAAVSDQGDIYVADGYGNSRVHHFDSEGRLVNSWGEPGNMAGQFRLPHGIDITPDGRLLVADRENDRIQVFTLAGDLIDIWDLGQRPAAVAVGPGGLIYVAEPGRPAGVRSLPGGRIATEAQHDRISILDQSGQLLGHIHGTPDISHQESLFAAHGVAVDSAGSVYVAHVVRSGCKARGIEALPHLPTVSKFEPVQRDESLCAA